MALAGCAGNSKPELEPLPAAAEVVVKYAPIDGGLLTCLPAPAAAEALGLVEAVKASDAPTQKKAALVVGILNVMLFRYDLSLADCQAKLAKIAAAQGKVAPGQ
jgi:hypothetical protein